MPVIRTLWPSDRLTVGSGPTILVITGAGVNVPSERVAEVQAAAAQANVTLVDGFGGSAGLPSVNERLAVIEALLSGAGGGVDAELIRDTIAAALRPGSNVTITADDNANTITIAAAGGTAYLSENARDDIAAALRGAGGATIEIDDAADTITIRSKNSLSTLDDVTATGAAVGKVVAVTGTGPTTYGLTDPPVADLPEVARTTADATPANLLGKTTRFDTASAAVAQTLPAATAGKVLAIGWDAGANALTLNAASGEFIGAGSTASLVVPLAGEVLTLHCTTAGRWRIASGFKPQASLDARFAPVTGPTRARIGMAVLGDSITAFQSSYAQAWHRQMAILSGQTILWRGAFGTSGYTLEQIETTHLPTVLALAVPPQICVIAGGTNNTGAASGYSEASSRATLLRIAAALEAKGIKPALWTLPPRDDDAGVRDRVYRWNAWIYRTALANGWPVVDAFGALADPATGLYKTALKLDSVHPNKAGHLAIAQRVLSGDAFTKHVQDFRPDFAEATTDTANLVVNGLFVGDTDSNGRADSWSAFGSPTHSLLPATFGNWQRVSLASGAAPSGAWRQDIPITAGRTYAMSALVHADLDPTNSAVTFTLEPQFRDASQAIAGDAAFMEMHSVLDTYGAGYREVVAPAGATTLRLTGILAGTPTRNIYADTAQVTVRDITALTAATS